MFFIYIHQSIKPNLSIKVNYRCLHKILQTKIKQRVKPIILIIKKKLLYLILKKYIYIYVFTVDNSVANLASEKADPTIMPLEYAEIPLKLNIKTIFFFYLKICKFVNFFFFNKFVLHYIHIVSSFIPSIL